MSVDLGGRCILHKKRRRKTWLQCWPRRCWSRWHRRGKQIRRSPCWAALFFFQAEDGIRYGRVTRVQTCALPIFCVRTSWHQPRRNDREDDRGASSPDQGVARPLLRQQFQIDGPPAIAGASARPGKRLQERHAGGDRFSAAEDSAGL